MNWERMTVWQINIQNTMSDCPFPLCVDIMNSLCSWWCLFFHRLLHHIRQSTSKTWPVPGRSNTSFYFMAFAPFSLPLSLSPPLVSPVGSGFAVFFSVSARVPWVIISTHKSNVGCQLLPSSLTHSHSTHSVYGKITRSGRETPTSWVNHSHFSGALRVPQ